MVVAHFNDGKDKYQLHEVYIGHGDEDNPKVHCLDDDIEMPLVGYGATRDEAFHDMKKKFDRYYRRLEALKITLDRESFQYVEVDCLGQKLDSK